MDRMELSLHINRQDRAKHKPPTSPFCSRENEPTLDKFDSLRIGTCEGSQPRAWFVSITTFPPTQTSGSREATAFQIHVRRSRHALHPSRLTVEFGLLFENVPAFDSVPVALHVMLVYINLSLNISWDNNASHRVMAWVISQSQAISYKMYLRTHCFILKMTLLKYLDNIQISLHF
jgi:hypothetical protein